MKKKLLYIAEPPTVSTGFGTVSRTIMPALATEYEIHALCTGGYGKECLEGLADWGATQATWTDSNDLHGIPQLNRVLKEYEPDVIFTYYDAGSVMNYLKNSFVGFYPHASYLITEGEPMMLSWRRMFRDNDFRQKRTRNKMEVESIILPSEYARQVALRETGVDCRVAYHGHDHAPWQQYPKQTRMELKKDLMDYVGQKWDLDNTCFITYNARNAGRKQWPRFFRAVARAQALKPSIKFVIYVHTKVFDNYKLEGWALNEEANQAGLDEDSVIFSSSNEKEGLPFTSDIGGKQSSLCRIYNTADIYFHPSSVEGAGLPLLEAARCGLPVLTTKYGGGWDYAKDFAMPIRVSDYYHHSSGTQQALIDIEDAANKLVQLASNKALWHEYSNKSLKNCNYKWADLGKQSLEAAEEAIRKYN